MIKRLTTRGFKSLRDVDLKLGSLNVFIGTNASGKSNFLDALRVLQGLAYGLSVHEILDGKRQEWRQRRVAWDSWGKPERRLHAAGQAGVPNCRPCKTESSTCSGRNRLDPPPHFPPVAGGKENGSSFLSTQRLA
jgi:energy-coupling factor transporter ATP-binding protein EcfA2